MKKYIFVGILLLGLMACEKVIDLELNSGQPRLVIEANLFFNKSYGTLSQQIQLSLSSSYFENNFIPARGAEVYVLDSNAKNILFWKPKTVFITPWNCLTLAMEPAIPFRLPMKERFMKARKCFCRSTISVGFSKKTTPFLAMM